MDAPEYVIVGRVRKPHGVRGELVVQPITDEPERTFAPGRRLIAGNTDGDVVAGAASDVVVTRARRHGEMLLVTLDAVRSRDDAEPWRGRYLLVPMSEIAPPGPGEAFVHELIGMRAVATDGTALGEVTDLFEIPGATLLEVAHAGGRGLVPLHAEFVRAIDREARRVTLSLPEGLFE